jgi:hypothetical protein
MSLVELRSIAMTCRWPSFALLLNYVLAPTA